MDYMKTLVWFLAKNRPRFDVMLVNVDFTAFQPLFIAKILRIRSCLFMPSVHLDQEPFGKGPNLRKSGSDLYPSEPTSITTA